MEKYLNGAMMAASANRRPGAVVYREHPPDNPTASHRRNKGNDLPGSDSRACGSG